MKQTRWLSEFSCLSEYTRIYPNLNRHKLLARISLAAEVFKPIVELTINYLVSSVEFRKCFTKFMISFTLV